MAFENVLGEQLAIVEQAFGILAMGSFAPPTLFLRPRRRAFLYQDRISMHPRPHVRSYVSAALLTDCQLPVGKEGKTDTFCVKGIVLCGACL